MVYICGGRGERFRRRKSNPEADTLGGVEDVDEPRAKLADFFSNLLVMFLSFHPGAQSV